jgi:transcription elongation factor GreA
MQKYPMTLEGSKLLELELEKLKTVDRPMIISAIAEARSHGDLSENAEYHAAKEKQSFIEGRIAEISHKLSLANIIDPTKLENDGRVIFGSKVCLLDLESEEEVSYQIVGDDEADIKFSKISVNSPVARSLIGKEIGYTVEVKTPNGIKEYEILDFSL